MSAPRNDAPGWTPARLERFMAMIPEGMTASAMAAELGGGLTRNAVLGKIHRLGLAEKWGGGSASRPRTKAQTLNDNRLKMRFQRRAPVAKTAAPAPPKNRPTPVAVEPVRFLDRKINRECSALLNHGSPVEELMCCGAPIPEGSKYDFCTSHQRQFLVMPRPGARRAA